MQKLGNIYGLEGGGNSSDGSKEENERRAEY